MKRIFMYDRSGWMFASTPYETNRQYERMINACKKTRFTVGYEPETVLAIDV